MEHNKVVFDEYDSEGNPVGESALLVGTEGVKGLDALALDVIRELADRTDRIEGDLTYAKHEIKNLNLKVGFLEARHSEDYK